MHEFIFETFGKIRHSNLEIMNDTGDYIKEIYTTMKEWKNYIIIKGKNLISANKFLFDSGILAEIDYRVYNSGMYGDDALMMLCFKDENHFIVFKLWNPENKSKEDFFTMSNKIVLTNIKKYINHAVSIVNFIKPPTDKHLFRDFLKKFITDDLNMWKNNRFIFDYVVDSYFSPINDGIHIEIRIKLSSSMSEYSCFTFCV